LLRSITSQNKTATAQDMLDVPAQNETSDVLHESYDSCQHQQTSASERQDVSIAHAQQYDTTETSDRQHTTSDVRVRQQEYWDAWDTSPAVIETPNAVLIRNATLVAEGRLDKLSQVINLITCKFFYAGHFTRFVSSFWSSTAVLQLDFPSGI
jgi:hypothetical protein